MSIERRANENPREHPKGLAVDVIQQGFHFGAVSCDLFCEHQCGLFQIPQQFLKDQRRLECVTGGVGMDASAVRF